MKAEEAIARLKGINCGGRGTSCPDQFARGLEAAMAQKYAPICDRIGTGTAFAVPVFSLSLARGKHLPSTVRIEWASETESRTERNRG